MVSTAGGMRRFVGLRSAVFHTVCHAVFLLLVQERMRVASAVFPLNYLRMQALGCKGMIRGASKRCSVGGARSHQKTMYVSQHVLLIKVRGHVSS
jgi:hypothetical protein